MARVRRWWLRLLLSALLPPLALGAAAWAWWLPAYVRARARAAFIAAGAREADCAAVPISPWRTRLENFDARFDTRAGEIRAQASTVMLLHAPLEFCRGRVREVRIRGLRVRLRPGERLSGIVSPPRPPPGGMLPRRVVCPDGRLLLTLARKTWSADFVASLDNVAGKRNLDFEATCPELGANLRLRARSRAGSTRVEFRVPRLRLPGRARARAGALSGLEALGFRGEVEASGFLRFTGAEPTASGGELVFHDLDFLPPGRDYGLVGVRGVVSFDSLLPARSLAGQELVAESFSSGSFQARDLRARFWLKNPGSLLLQRVRCDWAGGRLLVKGGHITRSEQGRWRADLEVRIEGVELQQVVDLIYPGRVHARGRLYGRVSLSYQQGGKLPLRLGEGVLAARPARGTIRLSEQDARLLLGVRRVVPLEQAQPEQAARIMLMQALQDLEYNRLQCRFLRDRGGWYAQMDISGKGPRGRQSFPVGLLRINLRRDLEKLVNYALTNRRLFQALLAELGKRRGAREATGRGGGAGEGNDDQEAEDAALDTFF